MAAAAAAEHSAGFVEDGTRRYPSGKPPVDGFNWKNLAGRRVAFTGRFCSSAAWVIASSCLSCYYVHGPR